MNNKANQIEPIPNEFGSYEEAAEFWDNHDTTDYLEYFKTVAVETEFRGRHYQVEISVKKPGFAEITGFLRYQERLTILFNFQLNNERQPNFNSYKTNHFSQRRTGRIFLRQHLRSSLTPRSCRYFRSTRRCYFYH